MRTGSDPLTEDPAELDARADEAEREQRWTDFIVAVILPRKAVLHHWSDVLCEMCSALMSSEDDELSVRYATSFERACRDFADTEGWDGVLSAIARAMREQAKASS